jgi:hypothetical protein
MASRYGRPVWFGVAVSLGITLASVVAALYLGAWLLPRLLSVDFGKMPPRAVFERVCNQPVPSGVSNLKAAGNGFGQGATVWLRFRATPVALGRFIDERSAGPLTAAEFAARTQLSPDDAELTAEKQKVGWEEIATVRHIRFYHFDATHGGQGWFGVMAVDRRRGDVWVFASVL